MVPEQDRGSAISVMWSYKSRHGSNTWWKIENVKCTSLVLCLWWTVSSDRIKPMISFLTAVWPSHSQHCCILAIKLKARIHIIWSAYCFGIDEWKEMQPPSHATYPLTIHYAYSCESNIGYLPSAESPTISPTISSRTIADGAKKAGHDDAQLSNNNGF